MENPYLTAGLPGTGGRIKVEHADFRVEEIPLYEPSGEGQHTYVRIEKEGMTTYQAIDRIARALRIDRRSIGYAGLKDAHAVTVQTLSLGDVDPAAVRALALPGIRVLGVSRHTNKLRTGHLAGNRFTVRVREVPEEAQAGAEAVLEVLQRRGVPNYFGVQRFGLRGDTNLLGKALVHQDAETFVRRLAGMPGPAESAPVRAARQFFEQGDLDASLEAWPRQMGNERRAVETLLRHPDDWERAARSVPKNVRLFFVSAYQSALFNRLLGRRLDAIDRLMAGDLANLRGRSAVFLVEDPATEQRRADRMEISPSGPLYGYKLTMAQGVPGEMEQHVLGEESLALEDFRLPGLRIKGARRPLRVPLDDYRVWYDEGLMLSFTLPPGAYATIVLDEVMKERLDGEERFA
jgi:tRNA pseudouridine13 synthase